jgi:multiple sugar transport system substrate-binding protein
MKKNRLSLLLPLIAVLGACGATGGNTSVAAVTSAVTTSETPVTSSETPVTSVLSQQTSNIITEDVTINLWSITGKTYQTQLNKFVEAFKAVEPHVTVNSVIKSGSYNDLENMAVSGFSVNDYPDMIQCYPDHVVEYLDYGKAVKLDDYIDNAVYGLTAEDKADYIQAFMDEGKSYPVTGTYSVPWDKSSELMFWNKDVLNGMDLSAYDATLNGGKPLSQTYFDTMTWEDLFQHLCPALVKKNASLPAADQFLKTDKTYHTIFTYDSDDNLFITLAQQYGLGYTSMDSATGKGSVDFNNDGMKNLMKTFHEAEANGYIESKGSTGAYTSDLFTSQNALFTVSSTAGASYNFSSANPMNVGVARIPHAAGKQQYSINQGPSVCLLDHADANRKLASWLFYRFMTNKDNATAWAVNTDYMAIRKSTFDTDAFKEAADADLAEDKTSAKLKALNINYTQKVVNATPSELFLSPVFKGSSECRNQAAKLMAWALTKASVMTDIDAKFTEAVNSAKTAM